MLGSWAFSPLHSSSITLAPGCCSSQAFPDTHTCSCSREWHGFPQLLILSPSLFSLLFLPLWQMALATHLLLFLFAPDFSRGLWMFFLSYLQENPAISEVPLLCPQLWSGSPHSRVACSTPRKGGRSCTQEKNLSRQAPLHFSLYGSCDVSHPLVKSHFHIAVLSS